jgi:hypothetical protein
MDCGISDADTSDKYLQQLRNSEVFIPIEETNLDKYFPKKDKLSSTD